MKYLRNKDIVFRTVAGENLLVPVNECTKKVFTLNKVGVLVWDLIETPRTANELADALVEQYSIAHETALQDMQVYLSDMVRLKLVIESDD